MGKSGGASRQRATRVSERSSSSPAFHAQVDTQSLASYMRSRHPATDFEFGGMRMPEANDAAQAFDDLARAYPAAAGRIAYFGMPTRSGGGRIRDIMARSNAKEGHTAFTKTVEGIGRTERYGIGLHEDMRGGALTQFHLKQYATSRPTGANTIRGVVTHEFGHVLDHHLGTSARSGEHIAWKRTADAQYSPPSPYAARQRDEYARQEEAFADGFAALRESPRSQWNDYTRALADHLRQIDQKGG